MARREMHFFEILFVAATVQLMTFPRTRHQWKYQHVRIFKGHFLEAGLRAPFFKVRVDHHSKGTNSLMVENVFSLYLFGMGLHDVSLSPILHPPSTPSLHEAKLQALVTLRHTAKSWRRNLQGYSWHTEEELRTTLGWQALLASLVITHALWVV